MYGELMEGLQVPEGTFAGFPKVFHQNTAQLHRRSLAH